MSFGDKAILWLHIAAAVFTIGPGTAAIMSTPRYIRNRNSVIVGYLFRTTRIYALGSLLVLVFGLILTGMTHKFSAWWISVSLTLFVVAFILLLLILRDQRRAITALDAAAGTPVGGMAVADNVEEDIRADAAQAAAQAAEASGAGPVTGTEPAAGASPTGTRTGRHAAIAAPPAAARTGDLRVAAVERGRIASIGGVTALIWLVILVLMVWH
jgi:signal transduction histidine kinase